jgi:hypothetical protein
MKVMAEISDKGVKLTPNQLTRQAGIGKPSIWDDLEARVCLQSKGC